MVAGANTEAVLDEAAGITHRGRWRAETVVTLDAHGGLRAAKLVDATTAGVGLWGDARLGAGVRRSRGAEAGADTVAGGVGEANARGAVLGVAGRVQEVPARAEVGGEFDAKLRTALSNGKAGTLATHVGLTRNASGAGVEAALLATLDEGLAGFVGIAVGVAVALAGVQGLAFAFAFALTFAFTFALSFALSFAFALALAGGGVARREESEAKTGREGKQNNMLFHENSNGAQNVGCAQPNGATPQTLPQADAMSRNPPTAGPPAGEPRQIW